MDRDDVAAAPAAPLGVTGHHGSLLHALHDRNENRPTEGGDTAFAPGLSPAGYAGKTQRIVSPPPGVPTASTRPPAETTTCLTIASPRPVPRVARARSERKKRSNSRGRSSSPTPAPSSLASSTTRSASR